MTPTGNAGPINGSLLNNTDFPILHINVAATTAGAITTLPGALTTNRYWTLADVTNSRTITITGGQAGGNFSFDNVFFDHGYINQTIKLGAVEKWTIVNNQVFGHSIHLHDIQFKIISRSGGPVEAYESGWKDTFYIPRGESVVVH